MVDGNEPVKTADLDTLKDGLLESDALRSKIEEVVAETVAMQTYWVGSLTVSVLGTVVRGSQDVERSQGLAFVYEDEGSFEMSLQAGTYRVAYQGAFSNVTVAGQRCTSGTDKLFTVAQGKTINAKGNPSGEYGSISGSFTIYKLD